LEDRRNKIAPSLDTINLQINPPDPRGAYDAPKHGFFAQRTDGQPLQDSKIPEEKSEEYRDSKHKQDGVKYNVRSWRVFRHWEEGRNTRA
jgi:hypothetical protein